MCAKVTVGGAIADPAAFISKRAFERWVAWVGESGLGGVLRAAEMRPFRRNRDETMKIVAITGKREAAIVDRPEPRVRAPFVKVKRIDRSRCVALEPLPGYGGHAEYHTQIEDSARKDDYSHFSNEQSSGSMGVAVN